MFYYNLRYVNNIYLLENNHMEEPEIQKIRDGFDELFLAPESELSTASKELFAWLWIEGLAEIFARSKKYGFHTSQKILQDLVKVSFVVYSNLDKLPLQKKVILPQTNWSYKFIVASLPHPLMRWKSEHELAQEDTNVIFMISTEDPMHAGIAERVGLKWVAGDFSILWWAWIDIDHEKKTLNIRDNSGSYGSCSNQFVQWMLHEHEEQGYTITINMKEQREFFKDIGKE